MKFSNCGLITGIYQRKRLSLVSTLAKQTESGSGWKHEVVVDQDTVEFLQAWACSNVRSHLDHCLLIGSLSRSQNVFLLTFEIDEGNLSYLHSSSPLIVKHSKKLSILSSWIFFFFVLHIKLWKISNTYHRYYCTTLYFRKANFLRFYNTWTFAGSYPGLCDSGRVWEALGCHDPYLGGPMGQHGSGGAFTPKGHPTRLLTHVGP